LLHNHNRHHHHHHHNLSSSTGTIGQNMASVIVDMIPSSLTDIKLQELLFFELGQFRHGQFPLLGISLATLLCLFNRWFNLQTLSDVFPWNSAWTSWIWLHSDRIQSVVILKYRQPSVKCCVTVQLWARTRLYCS
jgi:hypothetical protein